VNSKPTEKPLLKHLLKAYNAHVTYQAQMGVCGSKKMRIIRKEGSIFKQTKQTEPNWLV
jgi:hypothetical protein